MSVPIVSLLLVLGCAIGFAGADLLRKVLSHRIHPVPLLFLLAAGMCPAFVGWWIWVDASAPSAGYWIPGLGSVLLNVVANLIFLEAVRISPLSLTIPMLSLTPVFTSLLAIPLLGERPGGLEWLGIVAVVIGAFWLNVDRSARESAVSIWGRLGRERGSVLMILVAAIWSLALPLDKLAISNSSVPVHGTILNFGVALVLAIVLLLRFEKGDLREGRQGAGLVAALVVVSVVALGLQLVAITRVWVGFVETMKRAVGSLLALLSGWLILGEQIDVQQVLAVLLMGAGVGLVLL
jgi:drug/metabolite transporter (DMT)-like permease